MSSTNPNATLNSRPHPKQHQPWRQTLGERLEQESGGGRPGLEWSLLREDKRVTCSPFSPRCPPVLPIQGSCLSSERQTPQVQSWPLPFQKPGKGVQLSRRGFAGHRAASQETRSKLSCWQPIRSPCFLMAGERPSWGNGQFPGTPLPLGGHAEVTCGLSRRQKGPLCPRGSGCLWAPTLRAGSTGMHASCFFLNQQEPLSWRLLPLPKLSPLCGSAADNMTLSMAIRKESSQPLPLPRKQERSLHEMSPSSAGLLSQLKPRCCLQMYPTLPLPHTHAPRFSHRQARAKKQKHMLTHPRMRPLPDRHAVVHPPIHQ